MKHFLQLRKKTGKTKQPQFETQSYSPVDYIHVCVCKDLNSVYTYNIISNGKVLDCNRKLCFILMLFYILCHLHILLYKHYFVIYICSRLVKLLQLSALEDMAVVCYTSGTTGKPKGAMLLHKGLYHVVKCALATFVSNYVSIHTYVQLFMHSQLSTNM